MERRIVKMTERGYDGGVVLYLECGHTREVPHDVMLRDFADVYRAMLLKTADVNAECGVCRHVTTWNDVERSETPLDWRRMLDNHMLTPERMRARMMTMLRNSKG